MDTGEGFRGLRPKTGPGVLQFLFVFCVLTVFHNADEVLGAFFQPKMDFESLSLSSCRSRATLLCHEQCFFGCCGWDSVFYPWFCHLCWSKNVTLPLVLKPVSEVHHVAEGLGRFLLCLSILWKLERREAVLGSDTWWSVCCQSEFSLIQQKIWRTLFPIQHSQVS